MTQQQPLFAVEINPPDVSDDHIRRGRELGDEVGCALLYIRKEQAKTIQELAKRAGVKPNEWVIDAFNAYAQAQEREELYAQPEDLIRPAHPMG